MVIGEEIEIAPWFRIHFVENEGMAFGMSFGGSYGKLLLTLFRIVAVAFIGYILRRMTQTAQTSLGFVLSVSLIMAGALGNIIDSTIYGVIFSDSDGQVAQLFPPDGGYAPWLHGRVVDMLYFPLYEGFLPTWLPIWGGTYFQFFRPVFNIADAAITSGVAIILLFQRSFFQEPVPKQTLHTELETTAETANKPPYLNPNETETAADNDINPIMKPLP